MNIGQLFFAITVAVSAQAAELSLSDLYFSQKTNSNKVATGPRKAKIFATEITEVGLERGQCFGNCPAFTIVIRSDGVVRYEGVKFVDRIGKYSGKVEVSDLLPLFEFIASSDYMDLEEKYSKPRNGSTHGAAAYFTMVGFNGGRKIVSRQADTGPINLWAIEELIAGFLAKVKWDESSQKE